MKPSDFQKTVQCRFESCLKKVVRHIVKDYQQGLKRRKDKEIPFCELPEIFVENFAVWDDYETDYTRCWNMNKTKIRATEQPIAVDIEGLSARLSCGRATARKIGEQAGAKIVIGRRVLYSIEKVKKYLLYLEE